jgi:hypothetical protein
MKYFASFIALLLAAFAPCAAAQTEALRLVEIPPASLLEDEASLFEPRHIAFGMTPKQLTEAMRGGPDQKPAADLWVYWHFHAAADPAGKFTTLVVYFTEGRVTKFRLVERKALAALLSEVKKAQAAAVAKK